jgi:hypothetical protein
MAGLFSFERARELAVALAKHRARYLFIGKGGAVLLGFSDTTQDADLYVEKSADSSRAVVSALCELGFVLEASQKDEILCGKDFIQLRNGPFDLDLVFAPDGIERFEDAYRRSVDIDGIRVAHIDDIIRSKEAADRVRDRESLPRLRAFRDWLRDRDR